MNGSPAWIRARKVLCIRLDNMGDVLMTTPAMRALKVARPDRELVLLTSSAGAALGPFLPYISRVLTYDAPWVKNNTDDPDADRRILVALQQHNFDAAVIFTVYSQSALPAATLCRLAGIPLVLAHCRENPYRLLSHWVRETEPERVRHETQRQLDLVARAGAAITDDRLCFVTLKADRPSVYQKLSAAEWAGDAPWIVAHCGATAPSRRYPAEYYAEAFRHLAGRAGPVVLTGDSSERALTRRIRRMCGNKVPMVDLAGELSLGEFACLIEDAELLVSNNTGPVHIAAAVGTPVVDLYALTNPQHTPWKVPHRVLFHDVPCKYCYSSVCPEGHHACLRGVSPLEVSDAVLELLAQCRRPLCQPASQEAEQERSTC